jgi:MFS transporter, OFA family, oxalate/formate antiporter
MKRTIVVIAGILVVLGPGAIYSFSLLSGPVAAAFGWSTSQVSWAFAMANFFLAIGCFVGGVIADRKGPRIVSVIGIVCWSLGYAGCGLLTQSRNIEFFYLCYGVIGGFGCGMTYISALSAVIRWFPRARGFGGGLLIMGFGLGSFVYNAIVKAWAPFPGLTAATQNYTTALAAAVNAHIPFDPTSYMLPKIGVDHLMSIFFVSGIVFLVLGVAASSFLATPPEDDPVYAAQYQSEQFTLPRMLGDARFYILWATLFLSVFGGVTMISNMVPLMRELTGMSSTDAAGLYAGLAVCNGLGRFLWGAISDRIGRRVTFVILFAGQALAFVALGNNREVVIVAISIAVLLLCYGGGFGVMPAFNADFFGAKNFGANYGLQLSAWGLAGVAGTGIGAWLKDLTGSFAGMTQPIAIILLVAIFFPLILGEAQRQALEAA